MNRLLFLIAAILPVVFCGCVATRGPLSGDGHAFTPPPAHTAPVPAEVDPEQLPEPGSEKPIVRIIRGRPVESLEEAEGRTAAAAPRADLGQNVENLALRDVPLDQVCGLLTELCGFNIVATAKAARLPVTVFLRDLPLRQSLEAVCRLNNLWYREDQRIITLMTTKEYSDELVVRRDERTRAFFLRYSNANDMARVIQAVMGSQVFFVDIGAEEVYGHVAEEKEGGGAVSVEETAELSEAEKKKLAGLGLLREGEADARVLMERLGRKVPAIITVFKRNNAILARSMDESIIEEIGRVIEAMDTPTNQVLLEMAIIQLTLGEGFESFFKVTFPGSAKLSLGTMGSSSGTENDTLTMLFGNDNIAARLELFARDDRMELLATPFLMSANNAKVEFFVGEETPLRDDVESKTLYDDEGNPTTTIFNVTIKREELGTDIEISSFINEDGTITMDLDAELSTAQYNMTEITMIDENTGSSASFPLDGVARSELSSVITAVSGQPIAIGGIIREKLDLYKKRCRCWAICRCWAFLSGRSPTPPPRPRR